MSQRPCLISIYVSWEDERIMERYVCLGEDNKAKPMWDFDRYVTLPLTWQFTSNEVDFEIE